MEVGLLHVDPPPKKKTKKKHRVVWSIIDINIQITKANTKKTPPSLQPIGSSQILLKQKKFFLQHVRYEIGFWYTSG
jgi:hypothetical protein